MWAWYVDPDNPRPAGVRPKRMPFNLTEFAPTDTQITHEVSVDFVEARYLRPGEGVSPGYYRRIVHWAASPGCRPSSSAAA